MSNNSIAVKPKIQALSTADLKQKLEADPIKKTQNLHFAQLLHAGRQREEIELWRFFDLELFIQAVRENFDLEQIATIYDNAVAEEEEKRQEINDIDNDPEDSAYHYTHETDQVHNGVGMETIRSEYEPNSEMSEMLADLEAYESITRELLECFNLDYYLERKEQLEAITTN
jgi:hypothetical protein